MPSLLYLDLSENSLSGTIPNLANSPSIAHLFLNNNSFWGSLPENLPPSVIDAWFQYNTFTGEIPPQFGVGFENLTELLLHGNGLSGELSSDLCDSGIRLEADCLNDGSEKSIQCECCQCY
jgi:Leucine-rich repeat (LRR) protein